jgi:hypothetical protein
VQGPKFNPSTGGKIILKKSREKSWVWWCTLVIPSFGKLKWEVQKFMASLGYITRPCLKNNFGRKEEREEGRKEGEKEQ